MSRRSLAMISALLVLALLAGADLAHGQEKKAEAVNLKITMPHDKALLTIQGVPTRQTGAERSFVSPPLEPGREYEYKLISVWEPNNYTKITREKMVKVKA